MHIIFLTHYFPPEVNAPATRTFEHCRYWVKAGHKITVITGVPNAPEGIIYKGYKNKFFQREQIEGIDVLRVWTYVAENKGVIKRTFNHLSFMLFSLLGVFLVRGADVVVATSPQFFCAMGGYLFSRCKRKPFILEVRDLWPDFIPVVGAFYNKKVLKILNQMESFIYERADKIITLTDSFKRIINKKGVSLGKIAVVKNGVELDFFDSDLDSRKVKKDLGLSNKFIVSYIGTMGMAHGLMQVVDLAQKYKAEKKIVFLLVGSGAEKNLLMEEKEERGLDNILFIDKQSREKISLFYAVSDVSLVILKKNFLFKTVIPSKIFEIMTAGKPILLGVSGEARELVVDEACAGVHFEPENLDNFEEKLNLLYNNREFREKLGANGRSFVRNNFNRSDLAYKFLNILEEL